MTQGLLFGRDGEDRPAPVVYTIDTSSIMWLDGANTEVGGVLRFTAIESERIWAELRVLADSERLKVPRVVRDELRREHPEGLEHLLTFGNGVNAPPVSNRVREGFRSVTRQFPVVKPDWEDDPADPWLVAYAEIYGYTVINDELPADQHAKAKNRKKTYIPDICDGRNPAVLWTSLRKLATDLGWI